jgi:hypothetical protein
LTPARHSGLDLLSSGRRRGCRRDIRSNGWIEFSSLENRSGRRNKFSSFVADASRLRNFTGPTAWSRSGPDVFADALVQPAGGRARLFHFPTRLSDRSRHCRCEPSWGLPPGRSPLPRQAGQSIVPGRPRWAALSRPARSVAPLQLKTPTLRQWLSLRQTRR